MAQSGLGPRTAEIGKTSSLVRFEPAAWLSDWDGVDISESGAMIADMATVAAAVGLERFAFILRGDPRSPFACARRIRKGQMALFLLGGFCRRVADEGSPEQRQLHEAATTDDPAGMGSPNPVYRHFFTEAMMPDATTEQKSSFDELQRVATSPENAAAFMR